MECSPATLLKLTSFVFWSWLYLWCSVRAPHQSPEWCSRVVTLLHGSVASIAGLTQCGVTSLTECSFTTRIAPQQYALMVWSWGYFAFDLLWCLIYWSNNPLMLGHHASALAAITVYMQKDFTGCAFPCTLAMMEVTNPLLQTRWFLRNGGWDKTTLYTIVEVTYLALFLTIRGVLGTYLVIRIMMSGVFTTDAKLLSLVFYFISVAFIFEILGYVLYKYKTKIGEFKGYLEEVGVILNEQV